MSFEGALLLKGIIFVKVKYLNEKMVCFLFLFHYYAINNSQGK